MNDRPVRASRHPIARGSALAAACLALWAALGSLSDWGVYWLAWIFAGFLVPELYALAVNAKWTLSDNVWAFEHMNFAHPFDFATWTPVHWAVAIVVWLLFAWLSIHLPFALAR